MAERTYLDWNATGLLRPEAREAVARALEVGGNPSSVHAEGRAARRLVDDAREQVAELLGADPRNVVFTSGATEANMLALTPAIETRETRLPRERLLVSAIEHPSVLGGGRFAPGVETVPVRPDGVIDLAELERRLAALAAAGVARPLVSIMAANNETGVVQPIAEAAGIVHAAGGLLHVDAVQAVGHIPCSFNELQIDLESISSHKIGGPQGAGALVKRDESLHLTDPLIRGGGQERGQRAGTENVAAIAGFGAAAAAVRRNREAEHGRLSALRDRLEAGLRATTPDVVVFGAGRDRLPNTTLFAKPGIKAETALIALDLDGIAVSSGAACSSGKVAPSHVLAAMGVDAALARGAIRVSLGFSSTEHDIERFLQAWTRLALPLSKRTSGLAA